MESTLSVFIIFKLKKMPDCFLIISSLYQYVVKIKTETIAGFFAALGMAGAWVCRPALKRKLVSVPKSSACEG
jgi:hypothetical protein